MPGCAASTGTVTGGLTAPLSTTCSTTLDPTNFESSQGTWKLICCWPFTLSTAKRGAFIVLLNFTDTFKNCDCSGNPEVSLIPVAEVSRDPNTVAIPPGTRPPEIK